MINPSFCLPSRRTTGCFCFERSLLVFARLSALAVLGTQAKTLQCGSGGAVISPSVICYMQQPVSSTGPPGISILLMFIWSYIVTIQALLVNMLYLTYNQLADYCLALYDCTREMLVCLVAMHGADVAC